MTILNNRVLAAALVLSSAGFVGIASYEGYRSVAYNDGTGVTTIGFGTTTNVKPGDTVTVERALHLALADVSKTEAAVRRCVKVPLSQNEFDAYVSFTYNIGPTAFCNSTLVKKLNTRDYAGACAEISRWNKADGRVLKGLTKRRAAERAKCEGR